MVFVTKASKSIWRDFVTEGIPSTGLYNPNKSDIRIWGTEIELALTSYAGSATIAAASASAAELSRITAALAATSTSASAAAAATSASQALAAAGAAGNVTFFDTKALAVTGIGTVAEGALIEVLVDETYGGDRTRYRKTSGAYVYKMSFVDPLLVALDITDAEISMSLGTKLNCFRFIESIGTVSPSVYRSMSYTSGTQYEVSCYAKAVGTRGFTIYYGGLGVNCQYDLVAGTCSGAGSSIRLVGNGWYLCAASVTATSSGSNNAQFFATATGAGTYSGDGVSGFYIRSPAYKVVGTSVNLFNTTTLTNSYWTKQNVAINSDTFSAVSNNFAQDISAISLNLNGALTADKAVEASGSVEPSLYRFFTGCEVGGENVS
jgi:hypothetical protein